MTAVRDLMTPGVRCILATDTLNRAAKMMRAHRIGALPVKRSESSDELVGIVTDRDIIVKCLAAGGDPAQITAGDLAEGAPVAVEATVDAYEAVRVMSEARIRRLVILENGRPAGVISEADLARALPADQFAAFVIRVCARR
ncbi:CBS domain-containing protein [Streptomyces enissocaesilis]|uniref:Hypoxic response protein Hrp1 n=1 Tax=Streptomyces enissocaesilis TaxID=332589 RepID=A0ABP6JUU0_9ACTN